MMMNREMVFFIMPSCLSMAIYRAIQFLLQMYFSFKNFDYPEKPLKYKHIRRISD